MNIKIDKDVVVISGLVFDEEKRALLCLKKRVWILPGGKKESAETDKVTLKRECEEELGCEVQSIGIVLAEINTVNISGKPILLKVYEVKIAGSPKSQLGDSVKELGYFPLDNLPENLSTATTIFFENFLKT